MNDVGLIKWVIVSVRDIIATCNGAADVAFKLVAGHGP